MEDALPPNCVNNREKGKLILSRLEKDQSGIELMNSVKGEFVNLSEELTDDAVSIEDIDEVLQTLERATSSETEIEEPLIEESSSVVESDESMNEEVELDLSAGEMDKTSDPIRVYMREMGVVPLLTREQEVSIAKRIERGQKRAEKAIARYVLRSRLPVPWSTKAL